MPGLSRADNEVAMKQEFSLSRLDSHSGNKLATLSFFIGLALAFPAFAELRIVGPSFDASSPMNSAPSEIRDKPLPSISTASELLYEGPTRTRDTLWSIASRYQPKNASVSVYQTIGAIFKLNPAVFKDGNIHGLIPGSFLAMPTLDQIRAENTDAIVKLLQTDKGSVASVNVAKAPVTPEPSIQTFSHTNATPVESQPPPIAKEALPSDNIENDVVAPESEESSATNATKETPSDIPPKPTAESINSALTAQVAETAGSTESTNLPKIPRNTLEIKGGGPSDTGQVLDTPSADPEGKETDLVSLQSQLETSELEVGKLMESNSVLKRRLAEVQAELDALKEDIAAGKELDTEFKKYLDEQKALAEASGEENTSFIETLIANPLLLGSLALLPGLAIIGFGAYFIARRPEEELAGEASIDNQLEELTPLNAGLTLGDDEVKLNVDSPEEDLHELSDIDDLFNDEELFAKEESPESEKSAETDPATEAEPKSEDLASEDNVSAESATESAVDDLDEKEKALLEETPESLDEVFADMNEGDDFASVSTPDAEAVDVQAVGLEDMERAIDELDVPSEVALSPDEAMAASWEASLNESNNLSVDVSPQGDELDIAPVAPQAEGNENNVDNAESSVVTAEKEAQSPSIEQELETALETDTVAVETPNENPSAESQENVSVEPVTEDSTQGEEANAIDLDSIDDNDLEDPLGLTSTEVYADDITDEQPDNVSIDPPITELEKQLEPSINIDELNDIQATEKPDETIDLTSIPEYTEAEAAADIEISEPPVTSVSPLKGNDEIARPTLSETDPIDLEALAIFDEKDAMNAAKEEMAINAADMSNIDELSKSSTDETSGLDMSALLSDMDFFDIPENESNIWNAEQAPEPNLESEDWSVQPEMPKDQIRLMDLDEELGSWLDDAESELVDKSASNESLISIEDLVDDNSQLASASSNDLSMGINDFTSKASGNQPISLDTSEAANNMDLAKAYIAMNDLDGANILLNKILRSNNDTLKEEAVQLLESIK